MHLLRGLTMMTDRVRSAIVGIMIVTLWSCAKYPVREVLPPVSAGVPQELHGPLANYPSAPALGELEQFTDENPFSQQLGRDQELIDAAMDSYQAGDDFWEKGELEKALDALDRAYALILEVDETAHQSVLQQKEDLRFTIAKRIMEVYASRFRVVNGHQNAIPLIVNSHVEQALESFKTKERTFFIDAYVRSGRYRPAIVKALKEEGLPEELSWLPLIESGFKVRALSRAGALGLWQFIASTGYKFGLERNAWVDDRMSP